MTTLWRIDLPTEIVGARLSLRVPTEADADAFTECVHESVHTIGRFMSWAHAGYTPEEAKAWVALCRDNRARGDAFEYLAFDGGRLIGSVGLSQIHRIHRCANLGYWVRASTEGRGYASEAARMVAGAGIRAGIVRVEIVVDVENLASQRVAQKAGAVREWVARSRIFLGGRPRDAVIHSLIASDVQ